MMKTVILSGAKNLNENSEKCHSERSRRRSEESIIAEYKMGTVPRVAISLRSGLSPFYNTILLLALSLMLSSAVFAVDTTPATASDAAPSAIKKPADRQGPVITVTSPAEGEVIRG